MIFLSYIWAFLCSPYILGRFNLQRFPWLFIYNIKEKATAYAMALLEAQSRFELEHKGFADHRLTTWLLRRKNGAVDEARTRDLHLGKVALYQLSYYRLYGALGRNRTTDTVIFSHMLYRLSYQGIMATRKGLEPSTSSVTG